MDHWELQTQDKALGRGEGFKIRHWIKAEKKAKPLLELGKKKKTVNKTEKGAVSEKDNLVKWKVK